MKARELFKIIESGGGVLLRKRGDHYVYRFPSGKVLGVPGGGSQTEVSDGILAKVKRALRIE
jgi:predicted RNA binding protein YcfA (HicA-like mRNA interferase family)